MIACRTLRVCGTSPLTPGLVLVALLLVSAASEDLVARGGRACSRTAQAAFAGCRNEVRDDYWIAVGNCYNIADRDEREECLEAAREELEEARELCREQLEARRELCEILGEATYEPEIDPDEFVDFEEVIEDGEEFTPNPYFPLVPGTTREYVLTDADGEEVERVLVEVLHETREILGVNCIVVRDRVWEIDEDGEEELIEDTNDWLAQHEDSGDVWYFGEEAKDFEDGVLVSVEGSFEAGKDSAQPGIWVQADPEEGDFYPQEYHLGNAEDVAEVISVGEETVTVPAGEFSDGVLKTRDATPIEPDAFEFKFYAPGVGLVLEVNPESDERLELVDLFNP